MSKLTKHQIHLLQRAESFGGTINVAPDERRAVQILELRGLLAWNGQYIEYKSTITDAGRAAILKSRLATSGGGAE